MFNGDMTHLIGIQGQQTKKAIDIVHSPAVNDTVLPVDCKHECEAQGAWGGGPGGGGVVE